MEYQNFIKIIQAELIKEYATSATITIDHSLRNNSVILDTLTIRSPKYNIAPTIHLTPYYTRFLEGISISEILEDIKRTYEVSAPREDFDVSQFTLYEKAKQCIGMRLINTARNRELLKNLPHIEFLDLSIVFVYLLPDYSQVNASILIHNNHINLWGISEYELFQQAKINAPQIQPYTFEPIEDVISELIPSELNYEELPAINIYCLSNTSRAYGASALAYDGVLESISQRFNSDLTIIPSSIHELLIIPESNPDREQLEYMIKEVNELELKETEILSDHPYFYCKATKELYI